MESKITKISRIDRAVADNTAALRESFGEQALLVQDFVIFIMRNLKYNLFGFTEFTLSEFCDATGNSRTVMAGLHPEFSNPKSKKNPPEKSGVTFSTMFDYTLYLMMQRNLLFSKAYQTNRGQKAISMESIGVISDVHIVLGANGRKTYQVKLSHDLIEGFVSRYYTVDAEAYKLLGKGKQSIMRKTFLIYLCKIRHILFSKNQNIATCSVDVLAAEAGIMSKETFHTKQSLTRILDKIKKIGFPFDYTFVSSKAGAAKYYVRLTFNVDKNKQSTPEHRFFYALYDDLFNFFKGTYGERKFTDQEPFQRWLTTTKYDLETKIALLKKNYHKFFNIQLSQDELFDYIANGFISDSNIDEVPIDQENNDFDFKP